MPQKGFFGVVLRGAVFGTVPNRPEFRIERCSSPREAVTLVVTHSSKVLLMMMKDPSSPDFSPDSLFCPKSW